MLLGSAGGPPFRSVRIDGTIGDRITRGMRVVRVAGGPAFLRPTI